MTTAILTIVGSILAMLAAKYTSQKVAAWIQAYKRAVDSTDIAQKKRDVQKDNERLNNEIDEINKKIGEAKK